MFPLTFIYNEMIDYFVWYTVCISILSAAKVIVDLCSNSVSIDVDLDR